MCGHVGIAGDITPQDEKAFKYLLHLDTIRGPHSTGVMSFSKTSAECRVVKDLGTAYEFLANINHKNVINVGTHRVLLGHNRYATRGLITAENAHPFEHDHIIGAHNGTLIGQHLLEDSRKFQVDSDNIYYNMSKHGAVDTIQKLHGAFALVWFNKEEQSLNFIRNKQRELWYCWSKTKDKFYWASEPWMIEVALNYAGLDHSDPCMFKEMYMYTLPILNANTDKTIGMRYLPHKIRCKKIEEYVPPPLPKPIKNNSVRNLMLPNQVTPPFRGNVFQQHPPKGDTGAALIKKEYLNCYQKIVHFVVLGSNTKARTPHIVARTTSESIPCGPNLLVRIHPIINSSLWKEIDVTGKHFTGKVKQVKQDNSITYLLVEIRTVKESNFPIAKKEVEVKQDKTMSQLAQEALDEITKEEEEDSKRIKVGDSWVDKADFKRLIAQGCCMCADIIREEDAEDLHWIYSDTSPLCPTCTSRFKSDDLEGQIIN